jgi:DNA-binding response OmpR family regulator
MEAKKKVLVIDDDEAVLDVMKEALVYEGFDVKIADKADDIQGMISTYSPDVLLIDYILNGINGGEICHQIKENNRTGKLPVIIVSAYPKVLTSLGLYGCDKFIPKPFDLDDLVEGIKSVLQGNLNNTIVEHHI